MAEVIYAGDRARYNEGPTTACAQAPRQYRLDEVSNALAQNLGKASDALSKLRAIRERLSGSWPESPEKNAASPSRPGHIGRIEDQTIDLHKILVAIDDMADHLLGV